jgi:hypothetical protein
MTLLFSSISNILGAYLSSRKAFFNSEQNTQPIISKLAKAALAGAKLSESKETSMFKFIQNQRGQGIMEYVIISSLIGICCLVAVKQFGSVVQKRIERMKSEVVNHIVLK